MPSLMDKYMFKIFKYLSSIIGHEGNGSLLLFLKKHVWAVSLGVEYETLASHSEFHVSITLTKEGLKNVDKVLSAVFRYVFSWQVQENRFPKSSFDKFCSPV